MERTSRILGLLLATVGAGLLAWTMVTWQWRDPFTSLYTELEQRRLATRYEALWGSAEPAAYRPVAAEAELFRHRASRGDPIGRLRIPRLDLDMILVNGTDTRTLRKGPGRDLRSFMPGEGELVYVAGHRTTYGAPFAEIQRLRPGDAITLEMPYGVFTYRVSGHRIVGKSDLSVLRSPGHELLRLQACHPRFFASQRYVVSAALGSGPDDASGPA